MIVISMSRRKRMMSKIIENKVKLSNSKIIIMKVEEISSTTKGYTMGMTRDRNIRTPTQGRISNTEICAAELTGPCNRERCLRNSSL